jgi:hypothetical protein
LSVAPILAAFSVLSAVLAKSGGWRRRLGEAVVGAVLLMACMWLLRTIPLCMVLWSGD